MAVVTFNYTAWSALFPELAAYVTQPQATAYFASACYLCDNTDTGPVPAGAPTFQRDAFLNYITAHLAKLFTPAPGQDAALVGRISNAAQGSVSVAVQLVANPSDQMAFFMQTQYGLFYWTASQQFRTGFYVAPPCPEPPGLFGVYNGTPGYMNPFDPFLG